MRLDSRQKFYFAEGLIDFFAHFNQRLVDCNGCSATTSPESGTYFTHRPEYLLQSTWTNPLTNRLLLEAGANPNIQLKRRPPYRDVPQDRGGDTILAQGATALLRAARAGDARFVELLLKHRALVDLPSKEGVTPLMAAAGVEFGARVTRGRNRTNEGVLETMRSGWRAFAAEPSFRKQLLPEPRRRSFCRVRNLCSPWTLKRHLRTPGYSSL